MRRLTPLLAVLALLGAASAAAEEPTRESYKLEVEPICKANTEANKQILKGIRGNVKAGKLGYAAAQFRRAGQALKRTLTELKAVPQPPADRPRLKKWLGYVQAEVDFFGRAADKLANDDRRGALRMVEQLTRNANRANAEVLAFDFVHCRLDASKFT